MLYNEYKDKYTELQRQANEVFKEIKDTSIPTLEDSEWFVNQCTELNGNLTKLYEIYHEFRQLQATQYSLLVPEDECQEAQVQEVQKENSANDDVAVAAAGVAAIINLFRKARA